MFWIPTAMMIVSALSAGAILRSTGRIFLGLGEPGERDHSSSEGSGEDEGEPETEESPDRTPPLMWIPAAILLLAGLGWGIVPGLGHAALDAATRFTDTPSYAGAVLHGAAPAALHLPSLTPSWSSYVYGVGAVAGALAVAATGVVRHRWVDTLRPAFAGLRTLHSGHVGDYVAWLTAGVALIGVTFALTLR